MTHRPDEARLNSGRLRPALGLGIAALALIALAVSGPSLLLSAPLALALALFVLHFWTRRRRPAAHRLVFHPDRTIALDSRRGRARAEFVFGIAVGLRLDLGPGRVQRCVLFRDEMDPDAWRRLRAWLRHP